MSTAPSGEPSPRVSSASVILYSTIAMRGVNRQPAVADLTIRKNAHANAVLMLFHLDMVASQLSNLGILLA